MNRRKDDGAKTGKYLLWTFLPAYLLQAGTALLFKSGNRAGGQLVMTGMMFVPSLGVLLSGGSLKGLGWRVQARKNIRAILAAWFAPALLTAAGAALYFLVFPGQFDLSGSGLLSEMGKEAAEQLQAQGISYSQYVLLAALGALTYAPLLNTFAALGEEIGWRGFLYPRLKERYGRKTGLKLGGILWGIWHWPLIWLIGYEYGTEYAGFPAAGMLLFCVFTAACGILCDRLYEKSGSIWVPALFHGALNAAATLPMAVLMSGTGAGRLLGPAPNGLIAGLPLAATAALLLMKEKER